MNRLFTAQNESVVVTIDRQLDHLVKIAPMTRRVAVRPEQIATFMETTFWASLRSNEGRAVRFSATIAEPADVRQPMPFAEPIPYDEEHIAKMAPALPTGSSLAVSASTPFTIWGFGRGLQSGFDTISVDVSEPGILRVGVGDFHPYAILDGRLDPVIAQTKIGLGLVIQTALRRPQPVEEFVEQQAHFREHLFLADLARAVLAEGHGGALLLVSDETDAWKQSLSWGYRLEHVDTTIHDLIRQAIHDQTAKAEMSVSVSGMGLPNKSAELLVSALGVSTWPHEREIHYYATLASVDGAVVLTKSLNVLGCGAKINVEKEAGETVCILHPLNEPQKAVPVPIDKSGGTRHQSAVRFVRKHHDAAALVVSQDRHLSIVYWEPQIDSVVLMRKAEWLK